LDDVERLLAQLAATIWRVAFGKADRPVRGNAHPTLSHKIKAGRKRLSKIDQTLFQVIFAAAVAQKALQ